MAKQLWDKRPHISKAERAARVASAGMARYGLAIGEAQPARIGFGQSDGDYAPSVTGIHRPNKPCTESALIGRTVSVSVLHSPEGIGFRR